MKKTINIIGAKGGVGTSTVAAALAVSLSENDRVVISAIGHDDLPKMLGVPGGEVRYVSSTLTYVPEAESLPDEYDWLIVDWGTDVTGFDNAGTSLLVTTPDYVALSRVIERNVRGIDGIVVTFPEDRVLTAQDIERAIGSQIVATMNANPKVTRALDAGLFSSRLPESLWLTTKRIARIFNTYLTHT